MALFKKDRREPVPPAQTDVHDTSVGTAADVEAVMKKYDRESNTRVWEGLPKLVIRWLMVAFSVYCIIDTVFLSTRQEVRLPVFVGLILLFGFLTFPARKGDERVNHMPWYDIVLLIAGPGAYFFYAVNAQNVVQMSARVMQNDLYMIIGLIGILALVELCRRCVGLPILCVAGVLLVYTFFNLGGTADLKMTLYQVIRTMFYTFNGIFGGPISVCAKFIVVFIIFGAFLERTGIAQFFINLANAVAGAAPGGPAKVAVISSALCGMVSGSSVGNTVTTGSVTIPMMKKTGYKPEFAGAVEAAASTGGQIMPPIMGAAAFLMAEFTGEPYGTIAMRAILPAVLYFTGIYIAVHLEAKKLGLKGIPRDQLPRIRQLLPKIYLLAPLVLLVVMVSTNMYTMAFSAAIAIVAAVAVGLINNVVEIAGKSGDRSDFLTFGKIVDALKRAERNAELKAKEVEVTKQTLDAEIRAKADAQRYAAEQEAEAELYRRTKEAEAKKIERQREAEGIRAVGEAEAEAIRLKALAEAEGIDKKAEAMKKYGEAAVIEMIMGALPEIAKNVAEPLSKVDKITMYGEGNSAKLLSDIVNGTAQITEGISAGMGIDIKSLIIGALGGKIAADKEPVVVVPSGGTASEAPEKRES